MQVRQNRDEGMYQCHAYNELDSRYSSGQLRVLAFAPTFDKRPVEEKTYAAETGDVILRCKPEGAPQPKFTWRKGEAMCTQHNCMCGSKEDSCGRQIHHAFVVFQMET